MSQPVASLDFGDACADAMRFYHRLEIEKNSAWTDRFGGHWIVNGELLEMHPAA